MVGGHLLTLSTFLQLLPKFYVSTALLVGGRADAEWTYRQAVAQGLIVSLSAEMLWTWVHPRCISSKVAALALALSSAVTAAGILMACGYGGTYSPDLAFFLQVLAGVLTIPVNQLGASWRLQQSNSPARYRMFGWIGVVGLGTLTLVAPASSHPVVVVMLSSAFPLFLALQLRSDGDPPSVKQVAAKQPVGIAVSLAPALVFTFFSCVVGTNAEAVNDMAIGLKVRNELSKGRSKLALSNNLSILASQMLALASETGFWQDDLDFRSLVFCAMWCACQLCRAFGLEMIHGSSNWSAALVASFVFVDKYTGPLGQAALELAGIRILQQSLVSGSEDGWVPAAFLVSLRMATFKYERWARCRINP
jgi:hypothetical protein